MSFSFLLIRFPSDLVLLGAFGVRFGCVCAFPETHQKRQIADLIWLDFGSEFGFFFLFPSISEDLVRIWRVSGAFLVRCALGVFSVRLDVSGALRVRCALSVRLCVSRNAPNRFSERKQNDYTTSSEMMKPETHRKKKEHWARSRKKLSF